MPTPKRDNATSDDHFIPRDSVDRLLEDWAAVRPALDFSPLGVVARLARVRDHVEVELDRVFAEHRLTGPDFAVLVTLARLNERGGVTQRSLMDELGLTSGTVSVRMDRLQKLALVDRQPDTQDRRNTRITLTDSGKALFERILPVHLANERRLLAALSDPERELLAALLGKLLVEFEGSLPPPGAPLELGMTVAAAHVTISMRKAVGLAPVAGLLVRRVQEHGPAERAGLLPGDVIVNAARREIRSVAALYAAIADSAAAGKMKLIVLRGDSTMQNVRIELAAREAVETLPCAMTGGRSATDEHTL